MKLRLLAGLMLGISVASQGATISFLADLSGAAESPPNASPATGTGIFTVDPVAMTLGMNISFSGLTANTTAAHIHCCTAIAWSGVAGVATTTPTLLGFPSGVTSGSYSSVLDLTMASSFNPAFVTANGGTVASAAAVLLAGIDAGKAYLNIHTTAFPGGEIRGFLAPEPSTWLLTALPLAGLLGWRRRSRK